MKCITTLEYLLLAVIVYYTTTILQSFVSLTAHAIQPFSVSSINRQAKEESQGTRAGIRTAATRNYHEDNDDEDNDDDDETTKDVQELFFTQRLDHFASHSSSSSSSSHADDTTTTNHFFSQRYFYTSRYVPDQHHEQYEQQQDPYDQDDTTMKKEFERLGNSSLPRGQGQGQGQGSAPVAATGNNNTTTAHVIFICIGGEGPFLTKHVLTNSTHCSGDMLSLASILSTELQTTVHVFALEHRYYGKSYPKFSSSSSSSSSSPSSSDSSTSPLTTNHLKYLSSQQALADLAYFVSSYIPTTYTNIPTGTKVITFGGSYPGMLAAWSRLKYPHLIHAAVSNSAPLQVVLDFSKYKDIYARSLRDETVGGSDECVHVIHQAHLDAEDKILNHGGTNGGTEKDLEYIANLFHLCNGTSALKDRKSVDAFLGDGMVRFDVQGNDPSCTEHLCNIEKFCGNITAEARNMVPPLEILGRISRDMERGGDDDDDDDDNGDDDNNDNVGGGGRCKNISWEGMMEYLSRVDVHAERSGVRSWIWQTCTEVGFYQTCEVGSECPFGRGHHTIDADFEICQRVFGIEPEFVRENVEETLRTYGGWNISSSCILSVNGDIDPWSIQSLSASGRSVKEGDRLPSYWSIGASHHYWTHEVKGTDGFGIMRTRDIIYNWVISVLQEEENDEIMTVAREQPEEEGGDDYGEKYSSMRKRTSANNVAISVE